MWRTITFTGLALFQIIAAEVLDRKGMAKVKEWQLNCGTQERNADIIENNGNPQLVSCFKTELAEFGNMIEKYRNKTKDLDSDLKLIDYSHYSVYTSGYSTGYTSSYPIGRSELKYHVCDLVEISNRGSGSNIWKYNKEEFINVIKQLNKMMWIRWRERILGEYDELILNVEVLEALIKERIRLCSTELGLESCEDSTLSWAEVKLRKYDHQLNILKDELVSFENGSTLEELSDEILDSTERLASILKFCKHRKYCCVNNKNPIVVMSCSKEFKNSDCNIINQYN